jgi:hypothetical protein
MLGNELTSRVLRQDNALYRSRRRFYLATATATAVRLYLENVASRPDVAAGIQRDLAGKDLACWCPLPAAGEPDICHAAALLVIANQ